MAVTTIAASAPVNQDNIDSYLSGATKDDYYILNGLNEMRTGVKVLLAIVEDPAVNSTNIGSHLAGATKRSYYILKGLQEVFDSLGL